MDDFFTLWAGEELTVDEESGVLANDSDPEDDPLTAVLFEGPQYGSLQLAADGSFSYVPAIGFAGTDSFTYQASDGLLLSNLATVTLLVQARDDGIEIDIQPGDEDNKIDLAEPWVTVAILGSDTLDVTQIDVDSLRFGATGTENSIERDGKGRGAKSTIVFELVDLNGNGHLDLVVRFETKRTKLSVGDTTATLTGALLDGHAFEVTQEVEVTSSRPGRGGGKGGGRK